MNVLKLLIAAVAGYLIGSFSFSIVISRLYFGKDVREKGSGNAGATNMARSFGIGPGLITLAGDAVKAAVAMLLGRLLGGETGLCLAGAACITGHCFPAYYGFHGGKGVSAGLAILFAADWRSAVAALIVFVAVAFSSKKVSLGSLSAAFAAFLACVLLKCSLPRILMVAFTAAMIFIRHSENIRRLLKGEEPDFRLKKN
ncbi:MAG: glycerol-3-phosphate 1-O-acyltransferase PlsY [Eubacteriales bacterium]|nr:glycerol-3-phosphate 1-O-acyltransferase PlsY [Eubacteriales bacterium]